MSKNIFILSGCMATQPNVKLDKKRADDVKHYNITAELLYQSIIKYRVTNE